MATHHPKRLLVEGREDQYAVASLMSAFVRWGRSDSEWPVLIVPVGSAPEILKEGVLPVYLKESDVTAVGVVLDANDSLVGRWQRIRQLALPFYPDIPADLPREGLVHDHLGMPRFGLWVMPDNSIQGMLESFLRFLIPPAGESLWAFAGRATAEARSHGGPYKQVHAEKAAIHAWLAWQDPPGHPFGQALKTRCLDPHSPAARPFVAWFVRLFDLAPLRLPQGPG